MSSYSIAGRSLTKLGIDEYYNGEIIIGVKLMRLRRKSIKHDRKTKSTILGRFNNGILTSSIVLRNQRS